MCGILAVVSSNGAPLGDQAIDLEALRHRGPDNAGGADYPRVSLRHTRLAVIDSATTSNQPIVAGPLSLVCNGEIFNFRELRAAAGRYAYATTSDCEAVLQVYAEEGVDGFERLDGFFSFVLFDAERDVVIAHRDDIGKKPLFWAHDGRHVWFSSNATAIRKNASGAFASRASQLEHYLRHGFVHPAEGFYAGIEPVLPGETIVVDLRTGSTTRSRVARRGPDYTGFDFASPEAVLRETDRLLASATAKRLRGLRDPVLIFSGGVDSTLLATEIQRHASTTQLVTMRQPLPLLNDEPYARYAARRLSLPLAFAAPWANMFDRVTAAIDRMDQPLALESYFMLSTLAIGARAYGNVLFTGDGADEVFLGYREPAAWIESHGAEPPLAHDFEVGPPSAFPMTPWGRRQAHVDLAGHGFVKVDKATAENEMEARCPFLDRDLFAFARSIPSAYWTQARRTPKPLLKDLLASRGFSPWFVDRPKLGFAMPFRFAMIPHYGAMARSVERSATRLRDAGVAVPRDTSTRAMLRDFTTHWRVFVLAEVLRRSGES